MASPEAQDTARKMKLKILSNAEEVGNHVFENVPVNTTVGWIKQHLQNTLPSHPPTDAQRILYQARFLDNDNATLAQIFGEPVPEEQAFHLVLRAPRASRLNASTSEPRTASAPPAAARTPSEVPGQPEAPRPRTQVQSATVGAPHIELNIGNIGDQIQQALDQVQTQLHQAGFTHIQIPRVGSAVQRATQAEIDGALRDAGLQGDPSADNAAPPPSGTTRPSVTVSQHPSSNVVPQQAHPQHPQHPQHPPPTFFPPNVRVTQTLTGTALPPGFQSPNGGVHFAPPGFRPPPQHLQAQQRAMEMAAQHSQHHLQMMMQARNQQVHPAFRQPTPQPDQLGGGGSGNDAQVRQNVNQSSLSNASPAHGSSTQTGTGAVGATPGAMPHNALNAQLPPGQVFPGAAFQHLRNVPAHGHLQGHGVPIRVPPPAPTQPQTTIELHGDTVQPVTDSNAVGTSNFADRMQQIQRELEQVRRRTQELSSQRLSALGQMPSSVQQSELRDGFHTMAESLQRMRATLDVLTGDTTVANQPGFVPLRTLVEDWLLQVQAVEIDTSRWLSRPNSHSTNAAPSTHATESPLASLQSSVTAAFPPTSNLAGTRNGFSIDPPAGNPDNVMLVRDASGQPHALLVGPSGTYSTSTVPQDIIDRLFSQAQRPAVNRNDSFSRFMRRAVGLPEERRQLAQAPQPDLRQALIDRLRAVGARANQANQVQPPARQQNDQQDGNAEAPRGNEAAARDLLHAVMNPLWLIIRIAGMMYLFGGVGSGLWSWLQWRPLGIALIMLLAYLAQQPWVRRRTEGIRVHFEQLLGVPINRDGAGAADQPQGQAQAGAQQGQGGAVAPDRAAAARAADAIARVERPGQVVQGTFRERMRGVERALALFAASLVPGMGEGIVQARQIAEMEARTAAEAAAAQQEREREASAAAAATTRDGAGEQLPAADSGPASTDGAVGSSTQVDLAGGNDTGSELNRVNRTAERPVNNSDA